MKKICIALLSIIVLFYTGTVYAVDGYSFELQYEGEIKENEAKQGKVLLVGVNAPTHAKVRIKVDITGPATPKILANDSLGNTLDIAQIGYWGPDTGFAVSGTFTNTTPITATFPKAGAYSIKLSLIDLENSNNVIATKEVQINVKKETPITPPAEGNTNTVNNVIPANNTIVNNEITEIPKTGISIWEYVGYTLVVVAILTGGYLLVRKRS